MKQLAKLSPLQHFKEELRPAINQYLILTLHICTKFEKEGKGNQALQLLDQFMTSFPHLEKAEFIDIIRLADLYLRLGQEAKTKKCLSNRKTSGQAIERIESNRIESNCKSICLREAKSCGG